jgi:hypothetical protein
VREPAEEHQAVRLFEHLDESRRVSTFDLLDHSAIAQKDAVVEVMSRDMAEIMIQLKESRSHNDELELRIKLLITGKQEETAAQKKKEAVAVTVKDIEGCEEVAEGDEGEDIQVVHDEKKGNLTDELYSKVIGHHHQRQHREMWGGGCKGWNKVPALGRVVIDHPFSR